MFGQLTPDPVALDCDTVLLCVAVEVVPVVLVAANAIPSDESAATTAIARIE
jgi:hypothetical protein